MKRKNAILLLVLIIFATFLMGIFSFNRLTTNESSTEIVSGNEKENTEESKTMMVILKIREGDIFSNDNLKILRIIEEKLGSLPFVRKIDSILEAQKIIVHVTFTGINLETVPYFPDGKVSKNSREILNDKLYVNNLIDPDGKVVSFVLRINGDSSDTIRELKRIFDDFKDHFEIYMTGEPVVDAEIDSSVWILVFVYPPILFGLIWFIYFLRLKSMIGAIIPPMIAIISALWT